MKNYFALILILPLLSFLILALFGKNLSKKVAIVAGIFPLAVSCLLTIIAGINFISCITPGVAWNVTLWQWMNAGSLSVNIGFRLDALSLIFSFVITFVGLLIHLYSIEFMKDDEGFNRFFAYMNLFVCSMLILVLADNLLLLYLGWEGVGLCSYLLIGFWYKVPANGYAARKAFIITRIGDTALITGIILLFVQFGTLNINELMQQASLNWSAGSPVAVLTAALILGGAIGKSAQFPLQTWLPDAMAGPSPVSALIHAATMVTAGVYLIARTHILFSLAPAVQAVVAIIGAITLLLAGFSALNQHDLKRVLAYSTISQIGYMFLALGLGAWQTAIFHFMIHAFFKALLFLAGGVIILLLNEEHDMFKMGGLRKSMPVIFITFLIGSASLSALPFITSGFYSKDEILWFAWSADKGNIWLWLAAVSGAFITSLYTFRMVFITFFGEEKLRPERKPGKLMTVPLLILAVLSLIGGFVELPSSFGNFHLFSNLLKNTLPSVILKNETVPELLFQAFSILISLSGIYLAYLFFMKKISLGNKLSNVKLNNFFYKGWRLDSLYDKMIVRPIVWLSEADKNDFIDFLNRAIASSTLSLNGILSKTQNGKIRLYVMALTIGIVIILTLMLYL